MKQWRVLLRKDLLGLFRTKKILIAGIVFLLFSMLSPVLAKLMPEIIGQVGGIEIILPDPTLGDSYVQFASNMAEICLWVLIVLFGGEIVKERQSGQYTTLRNNGVTKINFILAKVVSQLLVTTILYAISVLLFSVYNYILFDAFWIAHGLEAILAMYVYFVFIISVVTLLSTLLKGSTITILLSLAFTMILSVLDLFAFGSYLPRHLVTITATVYQDSTVLDYFGQNILLTLVLSILAICLSIHFCKHVKT